MQCRQAGLWIQIKIDWIQPSRKSRILVRPPRKTGSVSYILEFTSDFFLSIFNYLTVAQERKSIFSGCSVETGSGRFKNYIRICNPAGNEPETVLKYNSFPSDLIFVMGSSPNFSIFPILKIVKKPKDLKGEVTKYLIFDI